MNVVRAYDRKTGATQVVAEPDYIGTQYAVSGRRVIWTDPGLNLADLLAGTTTLLDPGPDMSPAIAGDMVVWSGRAVGARESFDVYSRDLKSGASKALGVTSGREINPTLVGDRLVWQSDEAGFWQVLSMPVAQALTASPDQPVLKVATSEPALNAMLTRPLYKGIHVANGGGWNNSNGQPCNATSCPAIDALGAPYTPFFGSFVVLSSDLGRSTGRGSPWGPTVAGAMKTVQNSYASRVVVRTYPTMVPNSGGSVIPDQVAQQVVSLAQSYDWVKNVQMNNEPNWEWPASGSGVRWGNGNLYYWTNRDDHRLYQTINDFYSDAWWSVNYYKNNHPDPTVRARLAAMTLWTPPLADFYKPTDYGWSYDNMQGLLNLYTKMTYHTYPAPNYDADGAGGVVNNSWPYMGYWTTSRIDNGTFKSMITEFGWNPDQMKRVDCNLNQYSTWPNAGSCKATDNRTHTFQNDVSRFLAYHRHNAEIVAVWIVRDTVYVPDANGVDVYGNVRAWLTSYQQSSP